MAVGSGVRRPMDAPADRPSFADYLTTAKIAYWTELTARHAANVSAMARESGIQRTVVYRHLKACCIALPPRPKSHRGKWQTLKLTRA